MLDSIKTSLKNPLNESSTISEIINANKPTGVIPAAKTTLPADINLAEKYGKILAEKDTTAPFFGKWDINTVPIRKFEQLEDFYSIHGLKEDIYNRHDDLATAANMEYTAIEKSSRGIEKALPKNSGKILYDYAVSQQEGGIEALTAAGRTPVTQLTPELEAVHKQLRAGYNTILPRWNEARIKAGVEPVKEIADYTTFVRKYVELNEIGGNPITASVDYFKPRTANLSYAKERIPNSVVPMAEADAFKLYRKYMKLVLNDIYKGPLVAQVRDLAKSVREIATGNVNKNTVTAKFLDDWANQIIGKPRGEPLFGSTGHTPTNWAEKAADVTLEKLLGIKPITEGLDMTVGKVISNIGNSTLAGLFRTVFVQPFSTWLTYTRTGLKATVGGLKDTLSVAGWKYAKENSSKLKLRTPDVTITESLERLSQAKSKGEKAIAVGTQIGYFGIHTADDFAAVWAWNSGLRDGLKVGLRPGSKELFRHADDILEKGQGSAASGSRSAIQTHTGGKAVSLFGTFNINQWSFIWRDVLGIRNPRISKMKALGYASRMVISAAAVNSLMEYAGIPTIIPNPVSALTKKLREGGSFPAAAFEAVKELASVWPPLAGARYTGGSPYGAAAQFGAEAFKALKGEPSQVPLWTLPLRLRGVPGTVQLERLARVPGKLSLGEALFGKMRPDKPVGLPKKKSYKQIMEGQSYINDLFPDLDLGL